MSTSTTSRKQIFTALGEIVTVVVDGIERKKLVLKSPAHYQQQINHIPIGKQVAVTISQDVGSRSRQQLAYHMVLAGYLAEATGYTREEMHDVLMRMCFGTKKVRFLGREVEVRKSVSDAARLPTADMAELINYDLECCAEMGIHVPTAQELGYISN